MAHRYNNDVKHIKILTKEGCFYIAENKKFRSILVSSATSSSSSLSTTAVINKSACLRNEAEERAFLF